MTVALVTLPSDARRFDSVPAMLAAPFQFVAGLKPAVSVAAIAGAPTRVPLLDGRPPMKSMLTIS